MIKRTESSSKFNIFFICFQKIAYTRCPDTVMKAQIRMNPIRKARRRNTEGVGVDLCRDPRARGRRGQDHNRETNGRKEVGLGIEEIGRGPGAEVEIEGGTGVETERGAEAGTEDEVEAGATGEIGSGPGLSLQRKVRRL